MFLGGNYGRRRQVVRRYSNFWLIAIPFLKVQVQFSLFMKVKVRLAPSLNSKDALVVKDYFTLRFLAVRQAWQSVACIQPSELLTEGQAPTNYSLHSQHGGETERAAKERSELVLEEAIADKSAQKAVQLNGKICDLFERAYHEGEKGVPYNIRKIIQSHGRREQEELVPTKKEQSFLGQKNSGTQLFIDSEHELVGWWCPFVQLTLVRGMARQSPMLGTKLIRRFTSDLSLVQQVRCRFDSEKSKGSENDRIEQGGEARQLFQPPRTCEGDVSVLPQTFIALASSALVLTSFAQIKSLVLQLTFKERHGKLRGYEG
ncbi:hypothetical protein L6452_43502 [Arctium lappa]|uniref:Uncharacterized protein n=1 Tax=Arctium lappa TaxID=4217 RepID=A0ACB8XDJ9_ARCLA|nr:hypothetical protein L6452_43502 [Arctium lappa]